MSDDEEISLSASTLAALLEFKNEAAARQEEFDRLQKEAEERFDDANNEEHDTLIAEKGMDLFQEDWQLSQFWYSDKTADILADELLDGADEETVICIASAPSVYAAIKRKDQSKLPTKHIYLLEFDKRFAALARNKFGFYDYNNPLDFLPELKGKVNRLLIDPPFLEEECQRKSSESAHALLSDDKESLTSCGVKRYRLMSCTGERMRDIIKRVYPDTQITDFQPEHANGLSNEFACYASFEGKNWNFQKE